MKFKMTYPVVILIIMFMMTTGIIGLNEVATRWGVTGANAPEAMEIKTVEMAEVVPMDPSIFGTTEAVSTEEDDTAEEISASLPSDSRKKESDKKSSTTTEKVVDVDDEQEPATTEAPATEEEVVPPSPPEVDPVDPGFDFIPEEDEIDPGIQDPFEE